MKNLTRLLVAGATTAAIVGGSLITALPAQAAVHAPENFGQSIAVGKGTAHLSFKSIGWEKHIDGTYAPAAYNVKIVGANHKVLVNTVWGYYHTVYFLEYFYNHQQWNISKQREQYPSEAAFEKVTTAGLRTNNAKSEAWYKKVFLPIEREQQISLDLENEVSRLAISLSSIPPQHGTPVIVHTVKPLTEAIFGKHKPVLYSTLNESTTVFTVTVRDTYAHVQYTYNSETGNYSTKKI